MIIIVYGTKAGGVPAKTIFGVLFSTAALQRRYVISLNRISVSIRLTLDPLLRNVKRVDGVAASRAESWCR
jgi:hypothetical protein